MAVFVAGTAEPARLRDEIATRFAGAGQVPAYRALMERDGLTSLAQTLVAGDEARVERELESYRSAGATDLLVLPCDSPHERERTLSFLASMAARHPPADVNQG